MGAKNGAGREIPLFTSVYIPLSRELPACSMMLKDKETLLYHIINLKDIS
jgi:hypothetical protein